MSDPRIEQVTIADITNALKAASIHAADCPRLLTAANAMNQQPVADCTCWVTADEIEVVQ